LDRHIANGLFSWGGDHLRRAGGAGAAAHPRPAAGTPPPGRRAGRPARPEPTGNVEASARPARGRPRRRAPRRATPLVRAPARAPRRGRRVARALSATLGRPPRRPGATSEREEGDP